MKTKTKMPIDHISSICGMLDEIKQLKYCLNTLFDAYNSGAVLSSENYTKINNLIKNK